MRIKVEVDVDWISDEGSIDDQVSGEIKKLVTDKVFDICKATLSEKIAKSIDESLENKITETYNEFMTKSFNVVDQWGDIKQENVSVIQLLKEKLEKLLSEKVTDKDSHRGWGQIYRFEEILNEAGKKLINEFISELSAEVTKGIKEDINEKARKRITSAILSDYDLKKLIS